MLHIVLRPDGRVAYLNAMQGMNIMELMLKRITTMGSTLRVRDAAFKTRLAEGRQRRIANPREQNQVLEHFMPVGRQIGYKSFLKPSCS
ncbi:MAG: hypothetical protein IPO07_28110 [Haliscomenobacter sp.]|nr:hypothetical protein [Haliscomenobacter sp.]MBK9492220.1 hypothetical protein [Haliscomenobacter sp.]